MWRSRRWRSSTSFVRARFCAAWPLRASGALCAGDDAGWEKITRLQKLKDLRIADFGTRRRHGFLWQDWCVQAMIEGLGGNFLGTSKLPHRHAARGGGDRHQRSRTAHGLFRTGKERCRTRRCSLPGARRLAAGLRRQPAHHPADTYGTTGFLASAPQWMDAWTGIRIDSKDPILGGEEAIAWWKGRGVDPLTKQIIFSDGLDVDAIEAIHRHFFGKVRFGFGWGTLLTNDFRGLAASVRSTPFPWFARSSQPMGARRSRYRTIPPRPPARTPRSRATCACSTLRRSRCARWWCEPSVFRGHACWPIIRALMSADASEQV